jgi:FlaG/FlaF family flagellin (archaellin)
MKTLYKIAITITLIILIATPIITYFIIIPSSRPITQITIKPQTNATACTIEISGGQPLWFHTLYYDNSVGFTSGGTITTDKISLPTTTDFYARQGETFTVTITYYNQTIITNVSPKGLQIFSTSWTQVGIDKTELTIP